MGTRLATAEMFNSGEDHPHACGDKTKSLMLIWVLLGSSPRVWGQGVSLKHRYVIIRIIPTRVGTSPRHSTIRHGTTDHPHACGDKASVLSTVMSSSGSSPRVWGQACARAVILPRKRIIPTRVGTSVSPLCLAYAGKDHPHACGDKYGLILITPFVSGSSPRVWGQVKLPNMFNGANRIIPTRVGTSIFMTSHNLLHRDHPHACGDKASTR